MLIVVVVGVFFFILSISCYCFQNAACSPVYYIWSLFIVNILFCLFICWFFFLVEFFHLVHFESFKVSKETSFYFILWHCHFSFQFCWFLIQMRNMQNPCLICHFRIRFCLCLWHFHFQFFLPIVWISSAKGREKKRSNHIKSQALFEIWTFLKWKCNPQDSFNWNGVCSVFANRVWYWIRVHYRTYLCTFVLSQMLSKMNTINIKSHTPRERQTWKSHLIIFNRSRARTVNAKTRQDNAPTEKATCKIGKYKMNTQQTKRIIFNKWILNCKNWTNKFE